MCRWITLISSEGVSLSDLILAPSNSLVVLSRDASWHPGAGDVNNAVMNGDGFGIGWYHSNIALTPESHRVAVSSDGGLTSTVPTAPTTPIRLIVNGLPTQHGAPVEGQRFAAVYKDIYPAWNNMNLRELCMATNSDCIMAHVRAASKGTGISHNNCHPFKVGRLLFCHNGRIDTFTVVRRLFLSQLSDSAFNQIRGTTDSEALFGLILTYLERDGEGKDGVLPVDQTEPFGHKRLVRAVKKTLTAMEHLLEQAGHNKGYSTCNFSLTDGDSLVVTRYCDKNPDIPPPSLYFAFGNAKQLYHELTHEEVEPQYFMNAIKEETDDMSTSDASTENHALMRSSTTVSDTDPEYDERHVHLNEQESLPGTIMQDIDPTTAALIVASNPLTKTHTWHKLPRNSIMWCNRNEHPEMRTLRRRDVTGSIIASRIPNMDEFVSEVSQF